MGGGRLTIFKLLMIGIVLWMAMPSDTWGQQKTKPTNLTAMKLPTRSAFQHALEAYEAAYASDEAHLKRIRQGLSRTEIDPDLLSDEDLRQYAREAARQAFVQAHTEDYKRLFLPPAAAAAASVDVCDNGGFEEDFLYYSGYISTFFYGSDSCTPYTIDSVASAFIPTAMPLANRFEIVTTGNDTLVGIPMVKFGNKALRLNNKYTHVSNGSMCDGDNGVDRIKKQFVVTEANRDFTVWYALVLENPSNHENQQPFFSIRCDLDPANNLCFDADILDCAAIYTDTSSCVFDSIDVLNWTCHKFKIPKSEIGNTATLEITVSDCGKGAHFGYAYIDGICESCDSSALGTVILDEVPYYCDIDTPRICGNYILPQICNQTWFLKSLTIPDYQVTNLEIDQSSQTFCFDLPYFNFGTNDCIEVYAKAVFSNGNIDLSPQLSNTITVCKNTSNTTYASYTATVSQCYSNNPNDDNISDDYYFVTVSVSSQTTGDPWSITRKLDDPYPNETGMYEVANGFTDATVTLGPFLIQEGGWDMLVDIGPCSYIEHITPPAYCSGCSDFYGAVIDNVKCIAGSPNDTWSFDLLVPGSSGTYTVTKNSTPPQSWTGTFGTKITIGGFVITNQCLEFELNYPGSSKQPCKATVIVCPPKPCSSSCYVEAMVKRVFCDEQTTGKYYVELEASSSQGNLCYSVWDRETPRNLLSSGTMPSNQTFGPFGQNQEVEFSIYPCNTPTCFKMLYVPYPEVCTAPSPYTGSESILVSQNKLSIIPNPVISDEMLLLSPLERTDFEIYDTQGKIVYKNAFTGRVYRLKLPLAEGVYFLRYKGPDGPFSTVKLVKF